MPTGKTKAALEQENLALRRQVDDLEKQLAQCALQSAASHRELADSITDIFFAFDLELRYTYWNKASELVTGIPAATALGKSIFEIFPSTPGLQRVEQIYRQALETGQPRFFINEFAIADHNHLFEINVYPFDNGLAVFGKDVTANKQNEEALRTSEQRFRALVENGWDGIIVFNQDGSFQYASDSVGRLLGYSMTDLYRMTSIDFIHPEELPFIQGEMAQIEQQPGISVTRVHRVRRSDGSWIWIETTVTNLLHDPAVRGIVGNFRDITERKLAEQALQDKEERYQSFIAQGFEAISRTEFDQPIDITLSIEEQIDLIYANAYMAECNQAMADMYHIASPQDFVGVRLIEAHGGKDNPVNRAAFRRLIENNYRSVNDETFEYSADGQPIWFLSNTIGIVKNGFLTRLWGTAIDITDRKQMELASRGNEQKYSAIFHQSAMPAALVQLPERMIVDINFAIEEMFGYGRDEIIGKNSVESNLFSPAERERVYTEFQQGRLIDGSEVLFVKKSGEPLTALVKASTVEFGEHKYALITIQNITESKQARQELTYAHRQLQELSRQLLEAQENERHAMARELHDEIGQNLTGLKMLLGNALQLPHAERRVILELGQTVLDALIERVSRLSLDLRPHVLDDFGLLPALLWQLDTFTSQTGIEVDFTHDGLQQRRFVPAIETTIYRLVQAALTNIARHAGVKYAKVSVLADEQNVHLLVEDEGCGFDVQAVFARRETSGLFGMKERTQLLNGAFEVDSKPGEGTRIVADLPVNSHIGMDR